MFGQSSISEFPIAATLVVSTSPTTVINTTDGQSFSVTKPTLEMTSTDNEGDSIVYNIQIDTTNTFNSQAGLPLIDKTSGVDIGFLNTVVGGNISPFTSGQKVSYTIQSILPNATYYVRARGNDIFDTNAYGSWSAIQTFIVAVAAPNAPSGLTLSRTARTRNYLSWTLNGGGETGVVLEYSTDNASWTPINLNEGVNHYSHFGLGTSLQTYYYRVKATNTGGGSSYSSTVSHLMKKVNFFKGSEPNMD